MCVQEQRLHVKIPAHQRSDSEVPRSPVGQAGAREAASSAGTEDPSEGKESAGMPLKSPHPASSPGAGLEFQSTWHASVPPVSNPSLKRTQARTGFSTFLRPITAAQT